MKFKDPNFPSRTINSVINIRPVQLQMCSLDKCVHFVQICLCFTSLRKRLLNHYSVNSRKHKSQSKSSSNCTHSAICSVVFHSFPLKPFIYSFYPKPKTPKAVLFCRILFLKLFYKIIALINLYNYRIILLLTHPLTHPATFMSE